MDDIPSKVFRDVRGYPLSVGDIIITASNRDGVPHFEYGVVTGFGLKYMSYLTAKMKGPKVKHPEPQYYELHKQKWMILTERCMVLSRLETPVCVQVLFENYIIENIKDPFNEK